jgi:predicted TIM-barrel fold metal-dependent hydrolase
VACIRAWNDWLFEAGTVPYPERIVPLGITYLSDPELAVAEIRRNADRGFTSVTLPERPHEIGLPSLWDRNHWDPIIAPW